MVRAGLTEPSPHYTLKDYDRIDELVRDSFLDLKTVEQVMIALSSIVAKSKTHTPSGR